MSIIIRIQATGEVFDVMPGFKLEINNTSPIFNDLGSKSVSTTLPKTPHNMRLFGFSNRLDVKDKPQDKIPVIVSSGSYIRDGMLYQSTAYNTERTFGITIAFNEGIMYEAMSNILLTKLSNLPVIRKPLADLIDDMNMLYTTDNPDSDLSVFTVYYKKYTYTENEEEGEFGEYANGIDHVDGKAGLIRREQTGVVDNNELVVVEVPQGYGITPFVRVWRVLDLVFGHFGYTVKDNPFKSHFQLKRLCVLNNTIDTIVGGLLDYSQLMPKVTISDFLKSLYCRFGVRPFFNNNTNEVSLIFLRDVFLSKDYKHINLSSLLDPEIAKPKQLKLSAAKNLDKSSIETDTFEEFLAKYQNTIGIFPTEVSEARTSGIYHDIRAGLFYQFSIITKDDVGNILNHEKKLISSIHFDWNKKVEKMETEEITGMDECLTMHHSGSDVILYYGADVRLMNSFLTVNGQQSDLNTDNVLAFAYDMGEAYFDGVLTERLYLGHNYGSIFPFAWQRESQLQEDRHGNTFRYALTFVGEYGAFNNFFREYDAFLRHSNRLVKFETHPYTFDLSSLDFSEKRIVDGQPLLFDKVDHDLGGKQSCLAKVETRTLRLYEPYDLDAEHHLPVPDDILYQWVLTDNQEKNIQDRFDVLYAEKKKLEVGNPNHMFISLTKQIIEDLNPPTATTFWFLPPTEQQFLNNSTVGYRSHKCKVRFVHYYQKNEGTLISPDWVTYTERIEETINYNSWFEPKLIL